MGPGEALGDGSAGGLRIVGTGKGVRLFIISSHNPYRYSGASGSRYPPSLPELWRAWSTLLRQNLPARKLLYLLYFELHFLALSLSVESLNSEIVEYIRGILRTGDPKLSIDSHIELNWFRLL